MDYSKLAKQYGGLQLNQKSLGQKVGDSISQSFQSSFSQAKGGYEDAVNSSKSINPLKLLEGSVKMAAGGINALSAPLAPITAPIGKAVNYVGDKAGNNPTLQKFATSNAGKNTIRATEDISNLNTVVGAVAGGIEAPKVTGAVGDTVSNLANKVPGIKNLPPEDLATQRLNTAIKDATPNYEASTPTQKGKLLDRTQEGGMLNGRTVKSNALETEAGTELSKVPGYNPEDTKLAKYQVGKVEAAKRGQALEVAVENEKVVVPKREVTSIVNKVINDVPNKSLLLQKADPVIKNYVRVFKNAFAKEPGNLKGVLRIRKVLDDAYENARGKQAFGSDKISALDDVHKAARDTLTQYLVDHAKNVDVKASLRSQWNLYRALDELRTAAEKESGSTVGRFIQNNPLTSKAAEIGVRAAGFGAGIGLLK